LRPWTLALTSVAFFMVVLDSLVVITALPAIRREFGASLAALQWTVNAFTLAFASGIITGAALGDRFRTLSHLRHWVLDFHRRFRCVRAVGHPRAAHRRARRAGHRSRIVMPLSLTILTTAFPPEKRGTIMGIWGGIGGLAVASGPIVGGLITQTLAGIGSSG